LFISVSPPSLLVYGDKIWVPPPKKKKKSVFLNIELGNIHPGFAVFGVRAVSAA